MTFYVQHHLSCYTGSHLDEQNVCFERDVTALNTLTSHETIQPDRALVTILALDVGKTNWPSICDEIGPRCGNRPSIRDWPSI